MLKNACVGLAILLASGAGWAQQYVISTYAGSAPAPSPVLGLSASIGQPVAVATDAAGNVYFSSDQNRVFKLDPNGLLSGVAGNSVPGYSGDGGPATSAQLNEPVGLAVDGAGNLYIADFGNSRVRKVSTGGIITTVAGTGIYGYAGDGSPAISAILYGPTSLVIDAAGNLYLADYVGSRVRKVSTGGIITTVAGTGTYGSSGDGGPATSAQLAAWGLAIDGAGNLYISGDYRVRKVSPAGIITTVAGTGTYGYSGDGGPATSARLSAVYGMVVDGAGSLCLSDADNRRIRKVSTEGIITTVAGNGTEGQSGDGGPASSAQLDYPEGVTVDSAGDLYIADRYSFSIRKVSPDGIITRVVGYATGGYSGDGGAATSAQLNRPEGVASDGAGNLYIADYNNGRVRMVSPGGSITTLAGIGPCSPQGCGLSGDGGPATSAQLHGPQGVAVDGAGNIYIVDHDYDQIRKVSTAGIITTVAGRGLCYSPSNPLLCYAGDGGLATNAILNYPAGVTVDSVGNFYIADYLNSRVRKVSTSGIITTVAGNGTQGYSGDGGLATSAQLHFPNGVAVDGPGNLYIADLFNSCIRKVSTAGIITTVAGNGTGGYAGDGGSATRAELDLPYDVAFDAAGNLYIADYANNRIRKVSTVGIITTVAGDGTFGYSGDGGPATNAQLNGPSGVAVDIAGNVYVAEAGGNTIRLLQPIPGPSLGIAKTHSGSFAPGQTGATYTVIVSNRAGAGPTSGAVTVTETLPSGLTLVSMNGAGWSCSANTCTHSDSLGAGSSYPAITVTVNVTAAATSPQVNLVSVTGGGSASATASDSTIIAAAALNIGETHLGNFTQGLNGAVYIVTVSNKADAGASSGIVTVTEAVPPGLTLVSMSGAGWSCSSNICARSDALAGGASYPPITVTVNVAAKATSPQVNQVSVSGGGSGIATATDVTKVVSGAPALSFVPIAPCRVADTRNTPNGPFASPSISGNTSRDFAIPNSGCGVPATAAAYALNVTVVPHGGLGYLTIWPAGGSRPLVSTLNSDDGRVKANAAIVPADDNGAVSVYVTDTTDVILDVAGYFVPAATQSAALFFYPLKPCRVADTRNPNGSLGAPFMSGNTRRTFPVLSASSCNIPATAQAYSLNVTAVPHTSLGYITVWPTGQPQPFVSTLNAVTGTIAANAAFVPAGANGQIDVYATDDTDLVLDINGYFAPPGTGGLSLYSLTPCRVLDTRNPAGAPPFDGQTNMSVAGSNCGAPSTAQGYIFNATVVPPAALNFLVLWPQGQAQPLASTLNAIDGAVTSNVAIVATTNGSISAFASDNTYLILDVSGYFAP